MHGIMVINLPHGKEYLRLLEGSRRGVEMVVARAIKERRER